MLERTKIELARSSSQVSPSLPQMRYCLKRNVTDRSKPLLHGTASLSIAAAPQPHVVVMTSGSTSGLDEIE